MTTTTTTKLVLLFLRLACWAGIAAYAIQKVLRYREGASFGELFDFGEPSLWGLMVGGCVIGLILLAPKLRRTTMLIEANETRAATLSFFTVFTVMGVYYILRPIRDSMASDWTQPEISQLWTIQFFLSLALVMIYGFACSRIRLKWLVPGVYTFYAVTFALFFLASRFVADRVLLDKTFYVWVSLFSLFHLSVFWTFMADTFSREQAKRLFPFIGAGASAGAAASPLVVAVFVRDVGNDLLMFAGTGVLLLAVPLILYVQRLKVVDLNNEAVQADLGAAKIGGQWWAGFRDFARSPYMLAIGLFILIYTAIQAFIYLETTELLRIYEEREQRTTILALRDAFANCLTFGLGFFVTGQIVKRLGMPTTLAVLPVFCAVGFLILAMAPILSVLLAVDIARRAGEYGVTRPAREMLFTSVDRETRFKTKPVVDVVVYRGGDAWWGAIFAYVNTAFGLGFVAFSLVGAAFAAVWVASAVYLGRAFHRRENKDTTEPAATGREAIGREAPATR